MEKLALVSQLIKPRVWCQNLLCDHCVSLKAEWVAVLSMEPRAEIWDGDT